MCLLPPPSSLFLLTLVTDIPNSCCPTYCFASCYSRLPACLRRMSLEVMTILCRCENIETLEGVPLDVTGVAQVMHFKRPHKKKKKEKAVAGARGQRKTQENGSTNKLTCLCVFAFLIFIAFFPLQWRGDSQLSLTSASPVKLNSESPLATGVNK